MVFITSLFGLYESSLVRFISHNVENSFFVIKLLSFLSFLI